jgi:Zn-dependent peptidase ImmA (M78 family)
MKVPWISKEGIARNAIDVIQNFQSLAKYEVKPPIPVEDIIERYLGVRLIYDDLEKVFGSKDILGAAYVESNTICINERLFENSSEGRLVFTCGHEVGHWVLHRQYVKGQGGGSKEVIVCRTSDAKEPIEWQADYFSSCLLMPEKEIREAFEKVCDSKPIIVKNSMNETGGGPGEPFVEQWPFIAAAMCEAGGFSNVSKHAMIIRLQDLGLLVNKTKKKMDWEALCGDE